MSFQYERKGRFLIQEVVDINSNQNLVRHARRHNTNDPQHIVFHDVVLDSDDSKIFRGKLYKFKCEVYLHDYIENYVDFDGIWNSFLREHKDVKKEYDKKIFKFYKFCNIRQTNSNFSLTYTNKNNRVETRRESTNPNYSKSTIIESSDDDSLNLQRLNFHRHSKKCNEKLKIEKFYCSFIIQYKILSIERVVSFELTN
jgi:hypothetical protein